MKLSTLGLGLVLTLMLVPSADAQVFRFRQRVRVQGNYVVSKGHASWNIQQPCYTNCQVPVVPQAPSKVLPQPQAPAKTTPQTSYTQPIATQATYTPVPAPASVGDPYGFLGWINQVRAQYGLPGLVYDTNLEAWAHQNNAHQNARGIGHYVMGSARRQNSAMGPYSSVPSMWMQSPAHRAAILDPTITRVAIAGSGSYWTMNAN